MIFFVVDCWGLGLGVVESERWGCVDSVLGCACVCCVIGSKLHIDARFVRRRMAGVRLTCIEIFAACVVLADRIAILTSTPRCEILPLPLEDASPSLN